MKLKQPSRDSFHKSPPLRISLHIFTSGGCARVTVSHLSGLSLRIPETVKHIEATFRIAINIQQEMGGGEAPPVTNLAS